MKSRTVRIPRTSPRKCSHGFAQLVTRVDSDASVGGFIGPILRPGATVEEDRLWPDSDAPRIPILLECDGSLGNGRGHQRSDYLWILWRYNPDTGKWEELARAQAVDWTWANDLRPIAARALAPAPKPQPELYIISDRIIRVVDQELQPLDGEDKNRILAVIAHLVASRISNAKTE